MNFVDIPFNDEELVEAVGAAVKARTETAKFVKAVFQKEIRKKARSKLLGLLATRLPREE